jgi:hypothetical protein
MLKQPAFLLLAIGSMASIGAIGGTTQNLKLYLSLDRGFTQAQAGKAGFYVLVGSLVGRLLMGWLADRWAKRHVMLLIYTIVAVSIPLVAFAPTVQAVYASAFVFGIGLGGDYMIIPLMAAELFGLRVMGRLMGIVLTADRVAGPHRDLHHRVPAAPRPGCDRRAGGELPAAAGAERRAGRGGRAASGREVLMRRALVVGRYIEMRRCRSNPGSCDSFRCIGRGRVGGR